MARKSRIKKSECRKRYFADCPNCTASFEADERVDMQELCGCGERLTWNDQRELRTLAGKRKCQNRTESGFSAKMTQGITEGEKIKPRRRWGHQ